MTPKRETGGTGMENTLGTTRAVFDPGAGEHPVVLSVAHQEGTVIHIAVGDGQTVVTMAQAARLGAWLLERVQLNEPACAYYFEAP